MNPGDFIQFAGKSFIAGSYSIGILFLVSLFFGKPLRFFHGCQLSSFGLLGQFAVDFGNTHWRKRFEWLQVISLLEQISGFFQLIGFIGIFSLLNKLGILLVLLVGLLLCVKQFVNFSDLVFRINLIRFHRQRLLVFSFGYQVSFIFEIIIGIGDQSFVVVFKFLQTAVFCFNIGSFLLNVAKPLCGIRVVLLEF